MTATPLPAAVSTASFAEDLLDPSRLARVKRSFTTRNVEPLHDGSDRGWSLLGGPGQVPCAGDLVLARVAESGQHARLEQPDGRRATLYPGDEVVVAYGARYAQDQFEGVVPVDLGPCDLLAAGSLAGKCVAQSEVVDEPTRLEPIGLLAFEGNRVRLGDWTTVDPAGWRPTPLGRPLVVGMVGTAMNAGKTTALAGLVRGLTDAGLRVGAAKVTGTGAGGDLWLYRDAGAEWVRDFTDAGHPTTYQVPPSDLAAVSTALVDDLAAAGADVVVVEVADGVFQGETAALLSSPALADLVDGVLFAAGDALGAYAGAESLRTQGYDVLAVTGLFTASPLALREARQGLGDLVVGSYDLCDPSVASSVAGLGAADVAESA